ncbi:MAG TPA: hypothetical protein VF984_13525 [Actinomycetota bacterium]
MGRPTASQRSVERASGIAWEDHPIEEREVPEPLMAADQSELEEAARRAVAVRGM